MKCRSCGTEIAEKAIVCFRCGTPTDLPAAPRRPAARRPTRPLSIGLLVLLVIVALGLWLLPPALADGASAQYAGWAGLVLVVAVAAWLLRRRK